MNFYQILLKKQNLVRVLACKRKGNLNKLIVAYLNINSVRNKIASLADINKANIDILMISETKVDDSFPVFLR